MLTQIKEIAQNKIDNSHPQIIASVYNYLLQKHNDFCGCDYCHILEKYVELKKQRANYTRKISDFYGIDEPYSVYSVEQMTHFWKGRIADLTIQINELKAQKDNLKMLRCLDLYIE